MKKIGIVRKGIWKMVAAAVLAAVIIPAMSGVVETARAETAAPGTSAVSAILYEAESGTVLYTENVYERRSIASITKIMTALVVLEECGLEDYVEMKEEWVMIEGSSSGMEAGDYYTVEQLLYALMLASGNDVAAALACHTSGSIEGFAVLMNEKARLIGMTDTSFRNPHGLDEEGHYSTAYDMAILMAEAMKNEEFAKITSAKEVNIGGQEYVNHNKLLWNYRGIIGGKTGYTSKAGRTLVSCAAKNGMTLICVTLDDGDDWEDHSALYEWAGGEYRIEKLLTREEVVRVLPVMSGVGASVGVRGAEEVKLLVGAEEEVKVEMSLPRFVYAGVREGAKVGEATIYVKGEAEMKVDLVYAESVELDKKVALTLWEKIKWAWYRANEYMMMRPGYIY